MEEDRECRICRGGPEPNKPLLHPCKCAGSIRYVHQECLDTWLARTHSVRCELCHQPFIFSPLYAPNAPDVLSAPEFVAGVVRIGFKKVVLVLRILAVLILWILCLPIGTSWICRLYLLRSLNGLGAGLWLRMQPRELMADWMQGVLLSLLVIAVFLAVSGLRDYLLSQQHQQEMMEELGGQQLQGQPAAAPDAGNRPQALLRGAIDEREQGLRRDEHEVGRAIVDAQAPVDDDGAGLAMHDVSDGATDPPGARDTTAVHQDMAEVDEDLQHLQRLLQQQDEPAAPPEGEAIEAGAAVAAPAAERAGGGRAPEALPAVGVQPGAEGDDLMHGFLDGREDEVPRAECVGLAPMHAFTYTYRYRNIRIWIQKHAHIGAAGGVCRAPRASQGDCGERVHGFDLKRPLHRLAHADALHDRAGSPLVEAQRAAPAAARARGHHRPRRVQQCQHAIRGGPSACFGGARVCMGWPAPLGVSIARGQRRWHM